MPGPWRLLLLLVMPIACSHFNLRRDARPLATKAFTAFNIPSKQFQSQTRCQAPGDLLSGNCLFLLRGISISDEMPGPWRLNLPPLATGEQGISISDEMPGPWRRLAVPQELSAFADFNLRRDASPLASPDP